jgi:hypothetical protein
VLDAGRHGATWSTTRAIEAVRRLAATLCRLSNCFIWQAYPVHGIDVDPCHRMHIRSRCRFRECTLDWFYVCADCQHTICAIPTSSVYTDLTTTYAHVAPRTSPRPEANTLTTLLFILNRKRNSRILPRPSSALFGLIKSHPRTSNKICQPSFRPSFRRASLGPRMMGRVTGRIDEIGKESDNDDLYRATMTTWIPSTYYGVLVLPGSALQ